MHASDAQVATYLTLHSFGFYAYAVQASVCQTVQRNLPSTPLAVFIGEVVALIDVDLCSSVQPSRSLLSCCAGGGVDACACRHLHVVAQVCAASGLNQNSAMIGADIDLFC
ncbi:hypothetical protein D3C76_1635510 [compost metagenome]